jgi:hypothetical protein
MKKWVPSHVTKHFTYVALLFWLYAEDEVDENNIMVNIIILIEFKSYQCSLLQIVHD